MTSVVGGVRTSVVDLGSFARETTAMRPARGVLEGHCQHSVNRVEQPTWDPQMKRELT